MCLCIDQFLNIISKIGLARSNDILNSIIHHSVEAIVNLICLIKMAH